MPLYLAACSDPATHPSQDAAGGAGGDSSGTTDTEDKDIELFSWWIAAGEADALQALIDLHKERFPHETVVNAAIASGEAAQDELAKRLEAGQPPDLYQQDAFNLPLDMMNRPDSITPITRLFEAEGLGEVVIPEIAAKVTFSGEIYAMPVNVHRENALHYNKKVFEAQGIDVPTTLDEFLAACEAFKKAGIVPVATNYEGWVLRILFNGLLPASLGYDAFSKYFAEGGDFPEAGMRDAITLLDKVLTDYVNDSASDPMFGWTDCADLVFNGEAAMFIHGDWAKGYYTSLGWKPGESFGVTSAPDASDVFLYGVDTFALLTGAKEPEAAKNFLRTVASKEGQVAFNKLKGSSPIRLDVPTDDFDVVAQGTLQSLADARLRLIAPSNELWHTALEEFAKTRDADALLAVYRDNRASAT